MAKLDSLSTPSGVTQKEKKEKFNAKRFWITVSLVLFTAGVVGGPMWFFTDRILSDHQEQIDNLQSQVDSLVDSLDGASSVDDQGDAAENDETSDWKTYTDKKDIYSIKYPKDWVYDDTYAVGQDFTMVAFGEKKADLPAHESDQISAISITGGNGESMLNNYKASDKVKISSTTIGDNTKATKIALLPGRDEEMYGDATMTYYEVEISLNNYVVIQQYENYEQDTFDLMLKTFKLL